MQVFLITDRLLLRRFTEADVDNLVELDSDPQVMRFLSGGKPTPRAVLQKAIVRILGRYDRSPLGHWVAIERSTRQFLGWFALQPTSDGSVEEAELAYRLRAASWGQGYATEGARALIRKGFTELGVQRAIAQTMAVNIASRRVMEKSGLTYVRTFHEHRVDPDPVPGMEYGQVEYELLRLDWAQAKPA